jgi:hypothetical protein
MILTLALSWRRLSALNLTKTSKRYSQRILSLKSLENQLTQAHLPTYILGFLLGSARIERHQRNIKLQYLLTTAS